MVENFVTRVTDRHHEACRVMPKLSWVTEFSIRTENPLKIIFLAYSSFDDCIKALTCDIVAILRLNKYIFGSYLLHPDVMHEVVYETEISRTG